MKMALGLAMASSGLFLFGFQAATDAADAMLDANLNRMTEGGLRVAEQAVGSGLDGIAMTGLIAAFVPVIYRVVQAGVEAAQKEHQISVDRRRKREGLGPTV